jgi:alpha 1,6-mannosyltransferase
MATFRKAVIMAVVLLCMIFLLYPRSSPMVDQQQSSVRQNPPGTEKPDRPSGPQSSSKPDIVRADPGKTKEQQKLALAKIQNLPVDKQLAYHFPYEVSAKFPAFIWQTWKYTPASNKFSDRFRKTEASWTEKHPTFVHEVVISARVAASDQATG